MNLFDVSSFMGLASTRYHSYDPLKGVDLAAEYVLIQQKKSKLSANDRQLVVFRLKQEIKRAARARAGI